MTRQEWMNYPDEDMTYTDDGQPALRTWNPLTLSYDIVAVELEEGI